MNVEFIISASDKSQFPKTNIFEMAIVGKSNVGKSSLINSLLNRKKIAYTSKRPGKTFTINFFKINNSWLLVDLPGYGYAKISNKIHKTWEKLLNEYFKRTNINLIIFLNDIRNHWSENEIKLIEQIKKQIDLIIVLNKLDKLSKSEYDKAIKRHLSNLKIFDIEDPFAISVTKNIGLDDLKKFINNRLKNLNYKCL